jgi:hypothetical protein
MKELSSRSTPILKYFIPWITILFLIIGLIAALMEKQFDLALGILIVGTVIIGFMRAMLMNLMKVFIDSENKKLVVSGSIEESIPFDHIKEILIPKTPPYIATVQLISPYSFGKKFTFIPGGFPNFWNNLDEDLESKIKG